MSGDNSHRNATTGSRNTITSRSRISSDILQYSFIVKNGEQRYSGYNVIVAEVGTVSR
jgi:hypothetical protein